MNDRQARPSAALIVATIALAAAFTTTAIAGPGALTRAVSPAKVKKIAGKQIKKKAVLGPGKIVSADVRPPTTEGSSDQEVTILKVPGLIEFALDCDLGQMFWEFYNRSNETLHFSGSAEYSAELLFQEGNRDPDQSFGFVGGNSGGFDVRVQATSPSGRSVAITATISPKTATHCPVSAQAVVDEK
jgi:hypothetical protein